jgi:unspecific monooxygenase
LVAPLAWRRQDWATVLIPFIHRDPPVWGQDAEEFRPDRFLPENSHGRAPHSYIPFGTGERACIGRQFALHEAVLVLARLVHRYDIAGDPDDELAISERLTLMPKDFRIRLARRTPGVSTPTPAPTKNAVGSRAWLTNSMLNHRRRRRSGWLRHPQSAEDPS